MRITSADLVAKHNLTVLVLANALLGAQLPMVFTLGGLAGQSLASNACFATLPISMIVLGSMLSAPPMSVLMQRFSRKFGFLVGASAGMVGGATGAYALFMGSFYLFLLSSLITGVYMSAQGFYRFAVTDGASLEYRPKAISYVMSSGLVAAVLGTEIVKQTNDLMVAPFLGSYIAIALLNLCGAGLFLFLKSHKGKASQANLRPIRNRREILKDPTIVSAIACAMTAYCVMNLVMTSTPLAVVGCGFSASNAADVVRFHVLAMYIPSFFTGHLILRFGAERVIACGLGLLGIGSVIALSGTTLHHFYAALIFVGAGWNFGFVGGTTVLVDSHSPEERGRVQGMNDLFVFGGVTMASFASGGLMNCSGRSPQTGWTIVNIGVAPLIIFGGLALFSLVKRHRMNCC